MDSTKEHSSQPCAGALPFDGIENAREFLSMLLFSLLRDEIEEHKIGLFLLRCEDSAVHRHFDAFDTELAGQKGHGHLIDFALHRLALPLYAFELIRNRLLGDVDSGVCLGLI